MSVETTNRLADPALHTWIVEEAEFPVGGPLSDAIEFCVRYALLAPSSHNTQPWWFAIEDNTVTIGLDVARGLAVADPDDREATISVGAALFHLRVALAHFGFRADTAFWPDPHDPEACARLTVTDGSPTMSAVEPLFDAITRRHTSHAAFRPERVPLRDLDQLVVDAGDEGARLHVFADYPDRHRLAELVATADEMQMDDRRFRRELATWLRPAWSSRPDGIRGFGSDLGELMSVAAPLIVRTFDTGSGRAAKDTELASGSPVLAVLSTHEDDRSAWLLAGQALARVLLRATATNLSVGFLDQPLEIPELRARVMEMTEGEWPQLLLRLGYGPAVPPQPRRPVLDVIERR